MGVFSSRYGRLYLGDIRDVIRGFDDGSFDIIITDPPYGLGMDGFDDPQVFFNVEEELYRVLKPDSYMLVFYCTKYLDKLLRGVRLFRYVWMIPVINISYGRMTHTSIGFNQYSMVVVFAKGKPKPVIRSADYIYVIDELPFVDKEMIMYMRGKKALRQFKNTMAMASLLRRFASKDHVVLDPFSGYGSIVLTCEVFGYRWVGVEIDREKYMFTKNQLEKIMKG